MCRSNIKVLEIKITVILGLLTVCDCAVFLSAYLNYALPSQPYYLVCVVTDATNFEDTVQFYSNDKGNSRFVAEIRQEKGHCSGLMVINFLRYRIHCDSMTKDSSVRKYVLLIRSIEKYDLKTWFCKTKKGGVQSNSFPVKYKADGYWTPWTKLQGPCSSACKRTVIISRKCVTNNHSDDTVEVCPGKAINYYFPEDCPVTACTKHHKQSEMNSVIVAVIVAACVIACVIIVSICICLCKKSANVSTEESTPSSRRMSAKELFEEHKKIMSPGAIYRKYLQSSPFTPRSKRSKPEESSEKHVAFDVRPEIGSEVPELRYKKSLEIPTLRLFEDVDEESSGSHDNLAFESEENVSKADDQ